MTNKINLTELLADREKGTDGPWAINPRYPEIITTADNSADITEVSGWPFDLRHEEDANRRRIARVPDLEAAYIEAVRALERIVANDPYRQSSAGVTARETLERINEQ